MDKKGLALVLHIKIQRFRQTYVSVIHSLFFMAVPGFFPPIFQAWTGFAEDGDSLNPFCFS